MKGYLDLLRGLTPLGCSVIAIAIATLSVIVLTVYILVTQ